MKVAKKALICIVVFTLLCGAVYPVVITGVSQLLFKDKANGSIIEVNGEKYGSILLGQQFSGDKYLWGRIMNIDTETFKDSEGNVLMYSTPSNLSPVSTEYEALVKERVEKIKSSNPDVSEEAIPVDLVTSSGSGLDPHISVAAADYQIERVAKARNMEPDEVKDIIEKYTEGRTFGVFGEERVNVLEVNLALDGILK